MKAFAGVRDAAQALAVMGAPDLMTRFVVATVLLGLLVAQSLVRGQQTADAAFNANVPRPAYPRGTGPVIVIDEAHANFHTASGRYKPFADLLTNDGFVIRPGTAAFTTESLRGVSVLVISNAMRTSRADAAAFTRAEDDAVMEWVKQGGALLLIADHAPYGAAARDLALRFGVEMGTGYLVDLVNSHPMSTSSLIFSTENRLLADHPITRGRDESERVALVRTFTGQSVSVPSGATAVLKLSDSAFESPDRNSVTAAVLEARGGGTVRSGVKREGRSQGVVLTFGRGRVAVFGEAAMFSAQVVGADNTPIGMNVPGIDNRQFALNVMHWLARLGD